MKDLENAKQLLLDGGYTCVLVRGETVLTARHRGVKPLMQWLEEGPDVRGFRAADKVVGKAAACLYVLLGIHAVHAGVISEPAIAVLRENGIAVSFDRCVEAIRNRNNTGFCPMEQAVIGITSPSQAPEQIRQALARLAAQS